VRAILSPQYQERASKICRSVFARFPLNVAVARPFAHARRSLRRDYSHRGFRREEALDFGLAHGSGPDHEDSTPFEFHEHGKQTHLHFNSTMIFSVARASVCGALSLQELNSAG